MLDYFYFHIFSSFCNLSTRWQMWINVNLKSNISFLIPRKLSFPKDPGMSLYDNWQNDKKCKFSFPAFLFSAEKCKRTLKTNSAQLSLINLHNFLAVKPKKKKHSLHFSKKMSMRRSPPCRARDLIFSIYFVVCLHNSASHVTLTEYTNISGAFSDQIGICLSCTIYMPFQPPTFIKLF